MHIIFVDFKQAYDSVIKEELWNSLRWFGISQKYINLLRMCNINMVIGLQSANCKGGDTTLQSYVRATRRRYIVTWIIQHGVRTCNGNNIRN